MGKNSVVLVLHTHLPYVLGHGHEPHGEAWLYEAAAECYIPLLNVVDDLARENIKAGITFDISPVLCEQLADERFKRNFVIYCKHKIEAAHEDKKSFQGFAEAEHMQYLADRWADYYSRILDDFDKKYDRDIIGGFRKAQDRGLIEIMTCGVTHGYLPLLGTDKSVELQIEAAVANYDKHFGRTPDGIWLPECAYRPAYDWRTYFMIPELEKPHPRKGIEHFTEKHGIKYFVSDEKFIREMSPLGKFDSLQDKNFTPIESSEFKHEPWNFHNDPMNIYSVSSRFKVDEGSIGIFARHRELSMLVWSGKTGYPGEGSYLDFHKQAENSRLRYWRITDTELDMGYKQLYYPDDAAEKPDLQTNHFIHHIENSVNFYKNQTGKNARITLAFDTELFGHWWFEGPEFIRCTVRGLSNSPWAEMQTCREVYSESPPLEVIAINEGSWGKDNNHGVWINDGNKWTWEKIYKAELRFDALLEKYPVDKMKKTHRRILRQAMRELLLMQSSDWQFLIETGQARDYADHRFYSHHSDFSALCDIAERLLKSGKWHLKQSERQILEECEKRDDIFPKLTLEMWKKPVSG